MNHWTRWATVGLLSLLLAGCTCKRETPAEAPAPAVKAPRLEGEIHAAGQRKRVLPFVMHEPGLDLRVQCLTHRDALAKEGKTVPLCFDEGERKIEGATTTLRIEHAEGMRIAEAVHVLRTVDEGAHFVVDDGGTAYQLLDLAHAHRRAGTYQTSELRIMSGHAEGHARLVKALTSLYPGLKVETLPAKRPVAPERDSPPPSTPDP